MANLGIVRLSELQGSAQTGPVRQREEIMAKFAQLGVDPDSIRWAEDLDVSGFHVAPLKRPSLRRELDALPPGSTIVFYRLDRLVRRVFPDWSDILSWAAKHGHTLISATEPLSLEGTMGQMVATNLAFIGQMESENTQARVRNTQSHLRRIGRWPGGLVPYGYRPVKREGMPGLYLEIDPELVPVIRDVVDKVILGWSVNQCATWLNEHDVLPPYDRQRQLQGKPRLCRCGHDEHDEPCTKTHKCRHRRREGRRLLKVHEADECSEPCPEYRPRVFTRESLYEILRSPALCGYTIENKQILRDDEGLPVSFAPAIVDFDRFMLLQGKLDNLSFRKVTTMTQSLLLNVVSCPCGKPLYRGDGVGRKGEKYPYYRPSSSAHCTCPPPRSIRSDKLDELAEREILAHVGGFEVLRKAEIRPSGRQEELRQVGQQIAALTTDKFVRGLDIDESALERLQARHAELREMKDEAPQEIYVGTGQTFAARWQEMSTLDKRLWLLGSGVRIVAAKHDITPEMEPGPLVAEEIPRVILASDGDIRTVVYLGGMARLLRRVRDA